MASLFLTGASGFVGRQVHRRLLARGHRVVCLQRQRCPDEWCVCGDLNAPASYERELEGLELIVHLAAVTGRAAPAEFSLVNVEGTRALLGAARRAGVRKVLFCSSIAVKFPDRHRYFYAESKVAAEGVVGDSGLAATVIRPTIVAGTGSPVMARLLSLASLPLVPAIGGGRSLVQPILVNDLADFVVDLVETDRFRGEVLELGGPAVLSLRDLLDRSHRHLRGRPATFVPVPLAALLPMVTLLERLAFGAVPITVGQLATFRFDGVAEPNSLWEARRERLASVEQIIEASLAA